MHPVRKRKLTILLLLLIILGVVIALTLFALRQNISLFYTPTQIASGKAPANHFIRAGGVVVPGSIVRGKDDLSVRFKITDYQNTVEIIYHGILPDLFREGQGIVAQGELLNQHFFQAKSVLAKHDEKYMPPEVKDALKNNSSHVAGST